MPRWIRSRPAGRGLSKQALARIYWFTGMEMLGNRVLIVDQLEYINDSMRSFHSEKIVDQLEYICINDSMRSFLRKDRCPFVTRALVICRYLLVPQPAMILVKCQLSCI